MFRETGTRLARAEADEHVRLAAGWAAPEDGKDDVAEMLEQHVLDHRR